MGRRDSRRRGRVKANKKTLFESNPMLKMGMIKQGEAELRDASAELLAPLEMNELIPRMQESDQFEPVSQKTPSSKNSFLENVWHPISGVGKIKHAHARGAGMVHSTSKSSRQIIAKPHIAKGVKQLQIVQNKKEMEVIAAPSFQSHEMQTPSQSAAEPILASPTSPQMPVINKMPAYIPFFSHSPQKTSVSMHPIISQSQKTSVSVRPIISQSQKTIQTKQNISANIEPEPILQHDSPKISEMKKISKGQSFSIFGQKKPTTVERAFEIHEKTHEPLPVDFSAPEPERHPLPKISVASKTISLPKTIAAPQALAISKAGSEKIIVSKQDKPKAIEPISPPRDLQMHKIKEFEVPQGFFSPKPAQATSHLQTIEKPKEIFAPKQAVQKTNKKVLKTKQEPSAVFSIPKLKLNMPKEKQTFGASRAVLAPKKKVVQVPQVINMQHISGHETLMGKFFAAKPKIMPAGLEQIQLREQERKQTHASEQAKVILPLQILPPKQADAILAKTKANQPEKKIDSAQLKFISKSKYPEKGESKKQLQEEREKLLPRREVLKSAPKKEMGLFEKASSLFGSLEVKPESQTLVQDSQILLHSDSAQKMQKKVQSEVPLTLRETSAPVFESKTSKLLPSIAREWDAMYKNELSRPVPNEEQVESYYKSSSTGQKKYLHALEVEKLYWQYAREQKGTKQYKKFEARFISALESSTPDQRVAIEQCINLTKAVSAIGIITNPKSKPENVARANEMYQEIIARHQNIMPLLNYQVARFALLKAYSPNSMAPPKEYYQFEQMLDDNLREYCIAARASFLDLLMNDDSTSPQLKDASAKQYSNILIANSDISGKLELFINVREGLNLFFKSQLATTIDEEKRLREEWGRIANSSNNMRTIIFYELATIFLASEGAKLIEEESEEQE